MLTPSIPLVGLSGLYLQYQISSHTVPEWIPRGGSRYNLRCYNPSSTSSPPRLTITRPTAHAGHHIILLWNAHAPVHADEKSHQLWSDFESIFMGAFQSLRDDIEFTLRAVITVICDDIEHIDCNFLHDVEHAWKVVLVLHRSQLSASGDGLPQCIAHIKPFRIRASPH